MPACGLNGIVDVDFHSKLYCALPLLGVLMELIGV